MTVRGEILLTARGLTEGDRNAAYGDPMPEYERLAKMISGYLADKLRPDVELDAIDAVQIMVLLKINRSKRRGREDTYIDQSAYSAIAGEIDARS